MADYLVMHGVNLNMFGQRDPDHYGTVTLSEINRAITGLAEELKVSVDFFQSNHEGEFVERIHTAHCDGVRGLMVNAGAWSHYNYAIAEALAILTAPIVEVHMSNVYAREEFRHKSVIASVARGVIAGFGADSYLLGLQALVSLRDG